jgi:hypothetical protein
MNFHVRADLSYGRHEKCEYSGRFGSTGITFCPYLQPMRTYVVEKVDDDANTNFLDLRQFWLQRRFILISIHESINSY